MSEEDDFLAMFEEKVQIADKPRKIPETIKMTKGVMDKINTLCNVVDELTYVSSEWHAFLLANRDDPTALIKDIYIAEGAEVGPGETVLEPEVLSRVSEKDIKEYNKINKKDYVIVGVVHSHGNTNVFHSGTDDRNFDNIINAYSGGTKAYSREKIDLIEGELKKEVKDGEIIFSGSALEDAIIKYVLPAKGELQKILETHNIKGTEKIKDVSKALTAILSEVKLETEQTKSTGFAYSIVVNSHGETPYAETGIREFKTLTGEARIKKIKGVKVETVAVKDDITFSEEELLEEAANKFEFSKGARWKVRNLKRFYDNAKKRFQFKQSDDDEEESSHPFAGRSQWFGNDDYDDGYGEVRPYVHSTGHSTGHVRKHFGKSSHTTHSGNTSYKGPIGFTAKPELVNKVKDDSVEIEELVRWFVYSSLSYVSHYRFKDYKYSTYLANVLDRLDNAGLGLSTGKSKSAEIGLSEAIAMAGQFVEDEDKVPKPKMNLLSGERISRLIKENLKGPFKDNPEVYLMIEFVENQNIIQQNLTLEKYIPIILGE
ncbi:Mov34/MPN/PAD-1 family protein [archaeon]|nr:Mov34/MPN/PAD-1 family protein [archaeon]